MQSKRGVIWQELYPFLVGLLILFIVAVAYFWITGKLDDAINYFKTLWRFGR